MAQLTLLGLMLGLPIWYLTPPFTDMDSPLVSHYEMVPVQRVVAPTMSTEPTTSMTQPPLAITKSKHSGIIQPKTITPANWNTTQPKLKDPIIENHVFASSSGKTKINMKGSTHETIK